MNGSQVSPFRPATWPPALWAVLAVAVLLRVTGFHYGLPTLFYHHDEPQVVLRALRYGTGDFNPHAFRWPGTWMIDFMFLVYGVVFGVGRIAGAWGGTQQFAAQYFADPSVFYLAGRAVSLVLGLLTLPFVYALAERAASRRAAAWAALLLGLNWLHVDLSVVTVPTVPMLFWIALALYGMSDAGRPGAGRSLGIGVACGFAAACLYYGAWALLAWPGVLAARAQGGFAARLRAAVSAPFWLACAGAAAAFLVSCPWAVLDAHTFLHDLLFVNAQYATWKSPIPRALLPLNNLYELTCLVMPELLEWPGWLLAIAGGVMLWRRRSHWGRGVLVFAAAFGLLLISSRYQMPRYAVPLLPVTCVFAGAAIAGALERAPWLGRLALALAVAFSAASAGRVALDKSQPDTRELAKAWVESNIPAGSKMVVDGLHHRNTFTAPLDLTQDNVRDKIARLATEPSPYGSNEAYRLYYQYLLAHPGRRPYDQEWTEAGFRLRPLAEYRRLGFRYAMVSSIVYEGFRKQGAWLPGPGGDFYGGLERGATLLREFRGDRFLHPGPTIRIYDLSTASRNVGGPSPTVR